MARGKRQSDNVYNARRRYYRQAKHYLSEAEKASGLKRANYQAQARDATIRAAQTYAKGQEPQGQVKALMERQGIGRGTIAAVSMAKGYKSGGVGGNVERLVSQSLGALVGNRQKTRDQMASDSVPRGKRESDNVYNARRRYYRQAERYLAEAQKASGLKRARYQAQARDATIRAAQTYAQGQEPQGQVKALMERQGIDRGTIAAMSMAKGYKSGGIGGNVERLVSQSLGALVGNRQKTRDQMARDILSTGNVGSRFYGGLVQVWDETEESRRHPNRAILEFFGAESIMDVLEELEAQGIDLYTPDENDDVYKSVQLKLQQYILKTRRIRKNG